jgi:hypothetical protein
MRRKDEAQLHRRLRGLPRLAPRHGTVTFTAIKSVPWDAARRLLPDTAISSARRSHGRQRGRPGQGREAQQMTSSSHRHRQAWPNETRREFLMQNAHKRERAKPSSARANRARKRVGEQPEGHTMA